MSKTWSQWAEGSIIGPISALGSISDVVWVCFSTAMTMLSWGSWIRRPLEPSASLTSKTSAFRGTLDLRGIRYP